MVVWMVTAQSPTLHGGQQRNVKICMGNSTTSSPAQWKKAQQQALHGENNTTKLCMLDKSALSKSARAIAQRQNLHRGQ
jgi:hypothetical protein